MKDKYLFSFQKLVNELRENPEKKEIVEEYEKFYGPMPSEFKETDIYKQYVGKFTRPEHFELVTPDDLQFDFDWELLEQLTAASFSSDYWFEMSEDTASYQLYISVKSDEKRIVKRVDELWSFQIHRLFEIYIDEQIKLFALMTEEEERDAVIDEHGLLTSCHSKAFHKAIDALFVLRRSLDLVFVGFNINC